MDAWWIIVVVFAQVASAGSQTQRLLESFASPMSTPKRAYTSLGGWATCSLAELQRSSSGVSTGQWPQLYS